MRVEAIAKMIPEPDTGPSLAHMAGDLNLDVVVRIIKDVSAISDIVGLTIAEHVPGTRSI